MIHRAGRNNDRTPARQTTKTFFSGRNNDRAPARQTTRTFFSGRNNDCAPAKQMAPPPKNVEQNILGLAAWQQRDCDGGSVTAGSLEAAAGSLAAAAAA